MAPALLANGKMGKKVTKISKQNKRKMDPEIPQVETLNGEENVVLSSKKLISKVSVPKHTIEAHTVNDSAKTEESTPGTEVIKAIKAKKTKSSQVAKVPAYDQPAKALKPYIDFKALMSKLTVEDQFISRILLHIPSQGVDMVSDNEADTSVKEESTVNKVVTERAKDREELQLRLSAKLNQFRGKKLDFSDKQMKTKLKKKLEKLEKKKLKRKRSKMKGKIAKLAQDTKKAVASTTAGGANTDIVKTEVVEPTVQNKLPKPIFNNEGRMVFSKFDFGEFSAPTTTKKTTNDPKSTLHKMQKMKEKVKSLEAKGEKEKAEMIEKHKAWEGAINRAEGVKVKDNIELLAKSVKRKEKKKLQSKKKWDERIQAQEKSKEDRQKKRKANIKGKKEEKKQKKLSRLAKRGKIIV